MNRFIKSSPIPSNLKAEDQRTRCWWMLRPGNGVDFLKVFFFLSYLWPQKTAVGMWNWTRVAAVALAEGRHSRAHALPFQRAFSLSSSYWYLAILRTGFCTLKAVTESFLLVSHLRIACMLLKATRRYSVKGEGYRFEDRGPLDGGDLSKRYLMMLSLIRFMNCLQKAL